MGQSNFSNILYSFFFLVSCFFHFTLNAETDPLDTPSTDESPAIPKEALGLPALDSQVSNPINNQPTPEVTPTQKQTENLLDPFAPKSIEIIPEKSTNGATTPTTKDRITDELLNDDDSSFKEAPLKIKDLDPSTIPPKAKLPELSTESIDQKVNSDVSSEEIIQTSESLNEKPKIEEMEQKNEASEPTPNLPTKDRAEVILENNNINKDNTKDQNSDKKNSPTDLEPWEDPRLPITAECRAFLHLLKKKNLLILKTEGAISKIDDTLVKLQSKSAVKNQTEIDRLTVLKSNFSKRKKTFLFEKNQQEEKIIRRGCPGVSR